MPSSVLFPVHLSTKEEYLDLQEWQIKAIYEGLDEIKKGKVVNFADLKKLWEKKFATI